MPRRFQTLSGEVRLPDNWSQDQVDNFMLQSGYRKYSPIEEPSTTQKITGQLTGTKPTTSLKTKGIEFARPILVPLAGLGAGALGLAGGPAVAAGAATVTAGSLDQILQLIQGEERSRSFLEQKLNLDPSSTAARAASTAELLAITETGGRLISPLVKVGKSVLAAKMGVTPGVFGATVEDYISRLGGTFSQYAKRPISKFIEDVFAPGKKAERLEIATETGKELGEELSAGLAGRFPEFIRSPHKSAQALVTALNESLFLSRAASNKRAETARNIAKQNVSIIPYKVGNKVVTETIEGPIEAFNTRRIAEEYIKNRPDPTILPDHEKQLYNTAAMLIAKTSGPNGILKPLSFNDAWRFKQDADALGVFSTKKETGGHIESIFSKFSSSLNDDIEASITKWPVQGIEAKEAFSAAKAIVAQRNQAFKDRNISSLVNNEFSLKTVVNAIDDPKKLQKMLIASNLELPGVGIISSTNLKRDLQGFKLQHILNNALERIQDPSTGQVIERFNASKLFSQWSNPAIQDSLRLLFSSETRSNITRFLNALANVSQKPSTAGAIAAKIRIGGAGVTVGAGLLTQGLDIFGSQSGAIGGTVVGLGLGLGALAKVMTNPKAARYFTDLFEGRVLGVSDAFASRIIFGSLQGAAAQLQFSDGSIVPGKITKDRKFIPLEVPE